MIPDWFLPFNSSFKIIAWDVECVENHVINRRELKSIAWRVTHENLKQSWLNDRQLYVE